MGKDDLIKSHMSLAEHLAKRKKRSVGRGVYYEELESAAYRGLVDAAQSYSEGKGEFKYFAARRILGEMEDYLRELRWGSKANPINVCPLGGEFCATVPDDKRVTVDIVFRFVPEQARRMFSWYYYDGLKIKQIADRLGMSESNASWWMKKYKEKLRKHRENILKGD